MNSSFDIMERVNYSQGLARSDILKTATILDAVLIQLYKDKPNLEFRKAKGLGIIELWILKMIVTFVIMKLGEKWSWIPIIMEILKKFIPLMTEDEFNNIKSEVASA